MNNEFGRKDSELCFVAGIDLTQSPGRDSPGSSSGSAGSGSRHSTGIQTESTNLSMLNTKIHKNVMNNNIFLDYFCVQRA